MDIDTIPLGRFWTTSSSYIKSSLGDEQYSIECSLLSELLDGAKGRVAK